MVLLWARFVSSSGVALTLLPAPFLSHIYVLAAHMITWQERDCGAPHPRVTRSIKHQLASVHCPGGVRLTVTKLRAYATF